MRADGQRAGIAQREPGLVAARARDVAIAAQQLVEEERATKVDERRILRGQRTDRSDVPPRDLGANLGIERRRSLDVRDRAVAATGRQGGERGAQSARREAWGAVSIAEIENAH